MMKSLLLAILLTFATALGEEFKKAALLEGPVPENRVESFLNGRALIIKSKYILKECVGDLDLAKRWKVSESEAINSLAKKISASREPDTDLLRIEATGASEKEAEELLNGIIQANIAYFAMIERDRKHVYLEHLNHELQDQGDIVQDYRKAVAVLTQQYGIPYFANQRNIIGQTEMALYKKSQENLAELEHQRNLAQIQTRKLIDTPNEDLIRLAAGLDLPKNKISEYYHSYRSLSARAESLVGIGSSPNDTKLKILKKQAELALENAGKEVVSIKETLETKLNLIDKEVERMKEEVVERKNGCVDLSMRQHQYNTAAREYEAAQDLYYKMSRQQQELRIEAKMPSSKYLIIRLP